MNLPKAAAATAVSTSAHCPGTRRTHQPPRRAAWASSNRAWRLRGGPGRRGVVAGTGRGTATRGCASCVWRGWGCRGGSAHGVILPHAASTYVTARTAPTLSRLDAFFAEGPSLPASWRRHALMRGSRRKKGDGDWVRVRGGSVRIASQGRGRRRGWVMRGRQMKDANIHVRDRRGKRRRRRRKTSMQHCPPLRCRLLCMGSTFSVRPCHSQPAARSLRARTGRQPCTGVSCKYYTKSDDAIRGLQATRAYHNQPADMPAGDEARRLELIGPGSAR